MKNIDVRPATFSELERWWDKKIVLHPFDNAYKVWKECFISENADGKRRTFSRSTTEDTLDRVRCFFMATTKN